MKVTKKDICIVIPIYKEVLSINECLSFKQCLNVLNEYTIQLIHPESLNLYFYKALNKELTFKAFNNKFFLSTKSYNHLLLSPEFYSKFLEFKYIFLFQLDGWVFKDELLTWCQFDYDYIGAPWFQNPINKKRLIKHFIFNLLFIKNVGNGGVSLRKVSSHLKITKKFKWLSKFLSINEDVFFSLFPNLFIKKFKKPSWYTAALFVLDQNPKEIFEKTRKIPMSCHAWEKNYDTFWKKYINIKL